LPQRLFIEQAIDFFENILLAEVHADVIVTSGFRGLSRLCSQV